MTRWLVQAFDLVGWDQRSAGPQRARKMVGRRYRWSRPTNRALLAAILGLAALIQPTSAMADTPTVSPRGETLDLVVLNGEKPARLELRVEVDGNTGLEKTVYIRELTALMERLWAQRYGAIAPLYEDELPQGGGYLNPECTFGEFLQRPYEVHEPKYERSRGRSFWALLFQPF